jgi:hypothetical protein
LVKNNSRPFIFSFRLTFFSTTTWKPWYQSVTLTNHKLHPAQGFGGQLLALILIGFAAGICLVGTNNYLDYTFDIDLLSSLLTDEPSTSLPNPGYIFTLMDCKFFINSIFGLVGGARPLGSSHLVQWLENAEQLTDVSVGLTQMWAVLALTTLCDADIFGGALHTDFINSSPGLQVMLLVMSFIFTLCQFFLIIISTSLVFIGELVVANGLATANVVDTRTEVSEWLIAMWTILALINLVASTIDTTPGLGYSSHSLSTYAFPDIQVVLVLISALGVGSTTFYRLVMTTDVLHLDLSLLPSNRSCFTTPGSGLMFLGRRMFAVYGLATADVNSSPTP